MLREYTEQEHAKRLIKLLELPEGPCYRCPAEIDLTEDMTMDIRDQWIVNEEDHKNICIVCVSFIGVNTKNVDLSGPICPCFFIRKETVIKISWLALEEKGYLE